MRPRARNPGRTSTAAAILSVLTTTSLLFTTPATAQITLDSLAPENFLRRSNCRATVVGDYVYIDGGEISQLVPPSGSEPPKDRPTNGVNATLSIPINRSWSASSVKINVIPRRSSDRIPLNSQAIWNSKEGDGFYIFGGFSPYSNQVERIPRDGIWKLTVDGKGGGEWELVTPDRDEVEDGKTGLETMRLSAMGAYAAALNRDENRGYYFGGMALPSSDPDLDLPQPIPGMVTFDMEKKTFSNSTAPGLVTSDSPWGTMQGGAAVFVPIFGEDGLVVILGGVTFDLLPDPKAPGGTRSFSNVTIFDTVTGKWYWQETTGTAPSGRQEFCMVGAENPDGTTYEIFVYGGARIDKQESLDDLYVLSLPGFVWHKASERSAEPRTNPSCVVMGRNNRQMLSVGGHNHGDSWYEYWTTKDSNPQGLGILDLTEMKWNADGRFDVDAEPYDTPKVVKEWYEDNSDPELEVDWTSQELKNIFLLDINPGNSSSDEDAPTSEPNPDNDVAGSDNQNGQSTNNTASKSSNSAPAGAIAGGVVGGLAVLALVGGVVFWCLRRKHKKAPSELGGNGVVMTEDQTADMGRPGGTGKWYFSGGRPANGISGPPNELFVPGAELDAPNRPTELTSAVNSSHWEMEGDTVYGSKPEYMQRPPSMPLQSSAVHVMASSPSSDGTSPVPVRDPVTDAWGSNGQTWR